MRSRKAKYTIEEDYFQLIDSEEKAYWLGFITADGNIAVNSHGDLSGIAVNLAGKDAGHLEKMRSALKSNAPIRMSKSNYGTSVARISFCSKILASSLDQYGVTPAKSLTIAPWFGENHFMDHYWRGVFDGDGSISKTQISKKYIYNVWRISFNGNQRMVSAFRDFVVRDDSSPGYFEPHGSIYKISWGGIVPPKHVATMLYSNSHIHLDRKFSLASELMETCITRAKKGESTKHNPLYKGNE